jgi:7-carboxy-7-deazaguanine synthase
VPAYFIRLGKCNLMCGGHDGYLVEQGCATWWCDSETIWRKYTEISCEDLANVMEKTDVMSDIINGSIHLVWTGGEPTIPENVVSIMDFIEFLDANYDNHCYNEIETNGTIIPPYNFFDEYIDQINCSPKLANSGMLRNKRIVPEAIEHIMNHKNYNFKFVVNNEEDIKEIESDYITRFGIPRHNVIIMPGVNCRADLAEKTAFLFKMSKKYKYRGITRQHILAWDKTTGV